MNVYIFVSVDIFQTLNGGQSQHDHNNIVNINNEININVNIDATEATDLGNLDTGPYRPVLTVSYILHECL